MNRQELRQKQKELALKHPELSKTEVAELLVKLHNQALGIKPRKLGQCGGNDNASSNTENLDGDSPLTIPSDEMGASDVQRG